MTDIDSIIAENQRREKAIHAPFDPITGLNSPGTRRKVVIPGIPGHTLWLPVAMLSAPLMRGLLEAGSLDAYITQEFGPHSDHCPAILESYTRLRCRHDFPFWAAMFLRVLGKEPGDGEVPFILTRPQRKYIAHLEDMRERKIPIRVILLKARQWGGSTATQLYMAWLQLVHRVGLNSVIVSQNKKTSFAIKGMLDRTLIPYPVQMLHPIGEDFNPKEPKMVNVGTSGDYKKIPQRDCTITIASYEAPDALRGDNYALVHCSEVGLWSPGDKKTPEDVVRSACSGVMLRPYTMIVYESTANGTGNFFHSEWLAAKGGDSLFRPVFIAWFDIDLYRRELTLEEQRLAAQRLLDLRLQTDAPSLREEPGRYYWWLWEKGATLQAIEWYRTVRRERNSHAVMASEYPTDDTEAFVHSGKMVFDRYLVEALRPSTRRPPSFTGEIQGLRDSGPDALRSLRFIPDAQGLLRIWDLPPEASTALTTQGANPQLTTHNSQLTTRNPQLTTHNSQLTTPPPWLHRYLTAVDIGGRGADADWSVIVVFDRLDMADGEGPRVVAQWRGHIDHDLLAWKAAQIAAFYQNSLLVIESNTLETKDRSRDIDGDQSGFILNQIADSYPNLYARKGPQDAIADTLPRRYGFHTNTATKPMVISTLIRMVRDKAWTERDPQMLTELLQYEKKPNGAFGAIKGAHDDILMTRAIGLHIAYHEMPIPARPVPSAIDTRRLAPSTLAAF